MSKCQQKTIEISDVELPTSILPQIETKEDLKKTIKKRCNMIKNPYICKVITKSLTT